METGVFYLQKEEYALSGASSHRAGMTADKICPLGVDLGTISPVGKMRK
jgi:hypothetical protein